MVQKLIKEGASQKQVRELTGISERTASRIEKEVEVTSADEESFRKSRNLGRPSAVEQYESEIQQWFEEERKPEDGPLQSQEVLARLRAKGYTGGKTAVYELVRRLRPTKPRVPIVRFEGLPGEFSQHDLGSSRDTCKIVQDGSENLSGHRF